jgi:hypothetical protein
MVEGVDPGEASEAGRLGQKSAEAFDLAAEAAADPGFKETKLEEAQELAGDSALAAAYTHLQQIVGVMALLLPLVLFAGNWALTGNELESSISAYYYTPMGGVFVGVLWALGVFFLSYNYKPLPGFNLDNKLSWVASGAAVGVAVFPTTSDAPGVSQSEQNIGDVHMFFAALLFVLLAFFALVLFPRSGGAKTAAKRHRNILYWTCGGIMVVAILLMLVLNLKWVDPPDSWHAFLWLETICVFAFGISWLVKGGLVKFLNDPTPVPAPSAP